MVWRNCKASVTLVEEINRVWPHRHTASDGTIGDAAHATRMSDHNPWVVVDGIGVVRARDIDEDLDGNQTPGFMDARLLFDQLLRLAKAGDPRLNGGGYLIYEGHIYSEKLNWAARNYTGPNAHKQHIHVSFSRNQAGFDSTAPWGIAKPVAPPQPPKEEGLLMALTQDQQEEVLRKTRENNLMLKQIQQILLGDINGIDTQERQLNSLTRIEAKLKVIDDQVDPG
jgi:hypothetical protein